MKNDIEVLYLRMIAAIEAEKARSLKTLKLTPVLMDDGPVEEVRVKRIVIDSAPPLDIPDRPPQTAAAESNVTEIWAGQPPTLPVAESPTPETADADTAPVIAYVPADAQPTTEPPKPRPFRVSVVSFLLKCRKRLQDMYKRRDYVRGLDRAQRIINREYKRIVGETDAEFSDYLQEQEAAQAEQTPRREPIRRD